MTEVVPKVKKVDAAAPCKGRRLIACSDDLLRIFKHKIHWSALGAYANSEIKKSYLDDSEFRELSRYVSGINKFLQEFLTYNFSLRIADWADIDADTVVLTDKNPENCYGLFYFNEQLIALSKSAIWREGKEKVFLNFVHTLLHELIHAQSAHVFRENEKQKNQPISFQKPELIRQGLYYAGLSNALDEALTEILAVQATIEYFKKYGDKDVSEEVDVAYQDYIQRVTDILSSAYSDSGGANTVLFQALVLHKFGAIDYQELSKRFAEQNAEEQLQTLFNAN